MMKHLFYPILFVFISNTLHSQTQAPSDFLGYDLGSRFSHHHQILDYFEHLENNSDQIVIEKYGESYEGRPLTLAYISSRQNLDRLDEIRQDNLKRASLLEGETSSATPIVWLSYNVHGNESSSSEAVMQTAFELLNESSPFHQYLEDLVIILDPCINPDGRERYVHFYEQWGGTPYNLDPIDSEHREKWPGGRENHYFFDLNRDWAWQTQQESKQRLKVYNNWLPQIHVDFHEQGINSPYFFAPAAAPYHELISTWQREFQTTIGRNHAKYFDQEGWLYFTKEVFDLLYPSYGDTYPTFNGAIGMTYEQAGGGRGGLGVLIEGQDTLTLKDRIAHHNTTGLSTIETAALNKERLLQEFEKYFDQSVNNPPGKYKSFVIKNSNRDRIDHLAKWLDNLGIEYGKVNTIKSMKGYHYQSKTEKNYTLTANDLVIPVAQPKSTLAQVLFEPQTKLEDSLTYDITAWSAPYFYGLEAYANETPISINKYVPMEFSGNPEPELTPYAIGAKWSSLSDVKFMVDLMQHGINLRFTSKPGSYGGREVGPAFIATRTGNKDGFHEKVLRIADQHQKSVEVLHSGFADYGPDLGSGAVVNMKKPKIALLAGDGVSKNSFGQIRFFLEQEIKQPATIVRTDYLSRIDLKQFNTLILPSGNYYNLSDQIIENILSWVNEGGKLILVQYALNQFTNIEQTSLTNYFDDEEEDQFNQKVSKDDLLESSDDRGRSWLNDALSGAIYRVDLDRSHYLSVGLGVNYFTLKTSQLRLSYLKDGDNAGTIQSQNDLMSGYVGRELQAKLNDTLVFGTEDVGSGQIVYFVDNPLFRNFWYEGKLLFANALFLVGN